MKITIEASLFFKDDLNERQVAKLSKAVTKALKAAAVEVAGGARCSVKPIKPTMSHVAIASAGGLARASALTSAERTAIARKASTARWAKAEAEAKAEAKAE